MPVPYNIVKRGNPAKPGSPKMCYPSIVSVGRVTLRELAEEVSDATSLSTADMMAAIESLLMIIPRELLKGNIVDLGEFGSFWFHTLSTGSKRAEDVSGKNIRRVTIRFNAGIEFKRILSKIKFVKAAKRSSKK